MRQIAVEVVLAMPDRQHLVRLELDEGSTVEQAIRASGLPTDISAELHCGVFGRPRKPDDVLADGDRVEIYRALLADPKAARRARAAQRKLRVGARRG